MVTGRKLRVFVSERSLLDFVVLLSGTYSWTECVVAIVAGDVDGALWPLTGKTSRRF